MTSVDGGRGRFAGRTVVVTGASSGIGRATASRFAADGANLVVAARRQDLLEDLVNELGSDRALAVTTDVTVRADLERAMAAGADRFGGIDVLVSNAGNATIKAFEDTTDADWDHMMNLNAKSCFLGAQAALPYLTDSRGSIVHTASVAGLGGDAQFTAFNTAKGGVVNFTRSLAFDLGPRGIRVNAVAPGLTMTTDVASRPPYSQWVARTITRQALQAHGTPDDVAAAVAFLASDDARFITGVVLPIDGGMSAASGQPSYA